jgi:TonB family protein
MFLEYFKLVEQPFGVTPDPRYLFPSAGHREALASLVYGIESNLGFGTLIAQPGMGKTTLLFHILEQYRQSARTAFIFNTQCDSPDFLRSLLSELDDQPVPEQTFQLQERFKQILSRELQARRRVIVVIDEAQNLGDMVMETIRLLSNFESASSKLLHIILAGQPELAGKLRRPELSQLRQRIPILASLPQLSSEETFSYIAHRLHIAGHRGRPLFTGQSMAGVAHLSRGIPREINRICFNCLSLAYASSKTVVDLALVNEVAVDLGLEEHVMKEQEKENKKAAEVQEPWVAWRGLVRAATTSIQPPPSHGRVEPPTKEVLKPATTPKPPVRMPEAPRRDAAVAASKNPFPPGRRKTHALVPFSFSHGWESARRPVAFALFYLTLIAAGWSTISQWAYPNSPSDARTRTPNNAKKPDPQSSSVSWSEPKGDAMGSSPEIKTAKPSPVPSDALAASGVIGYQSSFELPITDHSSQASTLPELVRYVQPSYPEAARDRHLGGSVVLNVIVTKNGAVKDIRTVSGEPILARAAESAVRKWNFRPSQLNGQPIDVSAEIVIHFSPTQVRNR